MEKILEDDLYFLLDSLAALINDPPRDRVDILQYLSALEPTYVRVRKLLDELAESGTKLDSSTRHNFLNENWGGRKVSCHG